MKLVREIPDLASKHRDMTPLLNALDALISDGQQLLQLLKADWDKVKREAQKGALADERTLWERAARLFWG